MTGQETTSARTLSTRGDGHPLARRKDRGMTPAEFATAAALEGLYRSKGGEIYRVRQELFPLPADPAQIVIRNVVNSTESVTTVSDIEWQIQSGWLAKVAI